MKFYYTGLNKKYTIIIAGVVIVLVASTVGYAMFADDTPATKAAAEKKTDAPQNINVTVNNILDSAEQGKAIKATVLANASQPITIPAATLPPQLPPADNTLASNNTKFYNQSPQPQIVAGANTELPKPKMMVIGDNNNNNDDNKPNAISGTNTSIGMGSINPDIQKLRSPYTLLAGTNIPCDLDSGINSDVNGMIACTVTDNVYDTITGKYLLVPQGTKIYGTYNSNVANGAQRMLVGFNRAVYPNGVSFAMRGQPGTDLDGYSGVTGTVNNHYIQTFGSSFLMGAISVLPVLATGNQATNPYVLSPGAAMASAIGTQLSQTGIQVVQKGLNIPPTIIVPRNTKVYILMTADMILKPYIYKS